MLRSLLSFSIVTSMLLFGASALRADDQAGWAASDVSVPAPIWQGLYIGAIGGGQNTDGMLTILGSGATRKTSGSSGLGGVSAGYNWQSGNLVYGIEADWSAAFDDSGPGLVTYRGRAGWASSKFMIYATAGGGSTSGSLTRRADGQRVEENFFGWVAGGGVEAMLTQSISLKAEVLYFDAGDKRFDFNAAGAVPATAAKWELNDVVYRAGISYHFN